MKRVLLKSALALGRDRARRAARRGRRAALGRASRRAALQFVWQRVAPRLPPGVSIATVEGRLAGPLVLGGIAVQSETLELRVERVELRWNPLSAARSNGRRRAARPARSWTSSGFRREQPTAPSEPFRLPASIDLPVDVRVGSASVETLRFRSNPNAEPLSIERASLAGSVDADRLELRELVVLGPLFDVSGDMNVVLRGAYADERSARLDRAARRISGSARQHAILRQSRSAHDRAARRSAVRRACRSARRRAADGAAPRWRGCVHDAAGSVRHRAGAGGDGRRPRCRFRGTLDALDLTGRVELQGGEADGVAADISALYAGDAAEIRALDLVDAGSRAAVHASGRVRLGAEQPVLELDATWTELQWPLRGAPQVASDSGSLELRGTLRDYAVAFAGNLALADGTNGKVSASGTGDAETLNLERPSTSKRCAAGSPAA